MPARKGVEDHDRLMGAVYYGEQPTNPGAGGVPWCQCPACGAQHELRWGTHCRRCAEFIDFSTVVVEGVQKNFKPQAKPYPKCKACEGTGRDADSHHTGKSCPCVDPALRPIIDRLALSIEHWCFELRAHRGTLDDTERLHLTHKITSSWEAFSRDLQREEPAARALSIAIDARTGLFELHHGYHGRSVPLALAIQAAHEAVLATPELAAKAHGFKDVEAVRSHLSELGALLSSITEESTCPTTTGSSRSEGSDGDS